jgi:cell wall-associated NlpC family hydrolase
MGQFLAEKGLLQRIETAKIQLVEGASNLVVTAMGFLGVPYKRGGDSLETGFDCSGFVRDAKHRQGRFAAR